MEIGLDVIFEINPLRALRSDPPRLWRYAGYAPLTRVVSRLEIDRRVPTTVFPRRQRTDGRFCQSMLRSLFYGYPEERCALPSGLTRGRDAARIFRAAFYLADNGWPIDDWRGSATTLLPTFGTQIARARRCYFRAPLPGDPGLFACVPGIKHERRRQRRSRLSARIRWHIKD